MEYEENYFEEPLENDDMYAEFGEGFEDDFDAQSEKAYEKAFNKANAEETDDEVAEFLEEDAVDEDDYEFDTVTGGRDKKPIMSILNKGKLSKYEMDDLLNQL